MGNKSLIEKEEIQTIIESYEDHLRIRQIKDIKNVSSSEINNFFFFNLETANDITSILKAQKVVRTYSILSNLRKLTTNPVSKHLGEARNVCIQQSTFPDNVVPLDNGKPNKN